MDTDITVRHIPTDDLHTILPLVKTMNPAAEDSVLASRLRDMIREGYQCAGAYIGERLVGICGLWIGTHFYCGRYIEPDNVVVDDAFRAQGVGRTLMAWVYDYGRSQGCDVCELSCYVGLPRAHTFYFREGFHILGFRFRKPLHEG